MSFPRYPKYKDSGVEWLGQVPEHWEATRLDRTSDFVNGKAHEPFVHDDGRFICVTSRFISTDGEATKLCSENLTPASRDDVLMVMSDLPNGRALARTFHVQDDREYAINQRVCAIRPAGASPRYLSFLLNRNPWFLQNDDGLNQTHLSVSDFRKMPLVLPPVDEQAAIAAVLDRETAKIDALIAEQQRLIELLQEKRQAVISHAVTKGLNPDARMKDSGIEWLGEVPEHWITTPLHWLTDPERQIMYGIVLPGPDVGEGIPILKGGNVKPSRMNLQAMARTTPAIEAPYARARLKRGDLVYAIRGTIGDCEIVPDELTGSNITQDVARIAVRTGACATWVRWALLSTPVREDLACGSLGAAVRGVNIYDLKRAGLPTPPLAEQEAIAAFLDAATRESDLLCCEAQRTISLLQERRSALISAAVTGQIDVRGLAGAEAA